MADLPTPNTTLVAHQKYIRQALSERGFDSETVAQKFMLLLEEAGEFAKAARRQAGIKVAEDTSLAELKDEAGDVFIVLLDICNKLGIDLEESVIQKERKNQKRTWQ